jgi:hypothetical protein
MAIGRTCIQRQNRDDRLRNREIALIMNELPRGASVFVRVEL